MLLKNDIYSQFINSLHLNKKQRENEVKKCNHLFIKINTNKIECCKCGLTNKFFDIKKEYIDSYGPLKEYANDECYLFSKYSNIDIIDKELDVINTNHICILYKLSRRIKPFSDEKKIIQIMKILNEIETSIEKENTFDLCDCYFLKKRFKDRTYTKSAWSDEKIKEEIIKYADTLKVDISELSVFDIETYFDYKVSENRIVYALIELNNKNKIFIKKLNNS